MNHDEYKELLSAFLDGELSEGERAGVLSHLEACEDCQTYFAELTALHDALGDIEDVDAPEGFADGVLARLREEPTPQRAKKRSPWRGAAAIAACAAVVALAVAVVPNALRMGSSSNGSVSGSANTAAQVQNTETASDGGAFEPEAGERADESAPESAMMSAADNSLRATLAEGEAQEYGSPEETSDAAEPAEAKSGEYIDLTLSGAGAAEYLLAHGAEPAEFDGEYFVDASVLRDLPGGLTLGGAQADQAEPDGVTVLVRVVETEAAP